MAFPTMGCDPLGVMKCTLSHKTNGLYKSDKKIL